MLRLNLSTRPFYNERALHITLSIVGLLLLVLCALDVVQILRLSSSKTALETSVATDRARAVDARRRADALRAQVRQEDLERVLADAREANALIDRRTFSWTELFNHIEATLPSDVMLRSVRPDVKDGQMVVTLGIAGREVDDIEEFMDRLEKTGAFSNLLATDESRDEDGILKANLEGRYTAGILPDVESARKAKAAAPSATPGEVRR